MKLEYLRDRHGGRVVTMATATPVANSITEAHVMSRYVRPDLLEHAGVGNFDAWAATFGQTVTEIEMAPTGGGDYRMKTRFAKFQNVPEMLRLWHVFADVTTAEDLQLPTPQLAQRADGQRAPDTVLIEASAEVRAYVQDLGRRAEQVRCRAVTPEEDNMLKISTDGRKAALDMRLVTGQPSTGPSKLEHAAETIAALHARHRAATYLDADSGERSPIAGALQIVFCDLSTPHADRWNAYDELRALLEARGLPAGSVRFIHQARNDAEKARLFAACRAGHVSVLVGSTEKMGVGTNIQDRCVAIHHLDCPWRPADIEQRDGRGVRQGNQNPEIAIYRYAIEGSFDAYSWQTVERKARFINQIMRGRLDVREIEDIGENTLSFAEVKALASGDPLILDKARVDTEVTRLARLERAWQRNQHTLRVTIATAADNAAVLARKHALVLDALPRRRSTRGERFQMIVAGRTVSERADAAQLLALHLAALQPGQRRAIGEIGGFSVAAELRRDHRGQICIEVGLDGLPTAPASVERARLQNSGLSLIRQLEHRVENLPALADELAARRQNALAEASAAREQLTRPFKYAQQLADARGRQAEIKQTMQDRQTHDADEHVSPPNASEPLEPDVAEAVRVASLGSARPASAIPSSRRPEPVPATARTRPPARRSPTRGR
jgi:Helicase conserved C-terminal domain